MPPIPKPFQQGGTPLSDAQQKIQTWVDLVRSSLPESMVKTMGEMVLGMVPDPSDPQMADLTVPLMAPVVGMASRGALRAARKAGTLGQAAAKGAEEGTLGAALHRIPNPIKAYHGSPHNYPAERLVRWADGRTEYLVGQPDLLPDVPSGATVIRDFPLGRQRTDKIGTGQGAQTYGHGLYEAEAKSTADTYRAGESTTEIIIGGQSRPVPSWSTNFTPEERLLRYLGDHRKNHPEAPDADVIANARNSIKADLGKWPSDAELARAKEMERLLSEYEQKGLTTKHGHMYEVELHVDPNQDLLDWDKPLSEQPQKVREALGEYAEGTLKGASHVYKSVDEVDAGSALRTLMARQGQEGASEALKAKGIKGIQYLDQGSRAAGTGTRNFVIFDDQLIEIRKKFGFATTAAAAEWVRQNGGVVQSRDE